MAFLLQLGPFFYNERKAGQDKMFILTLTLYLPAFRGKKNQNLSAWEKYFLPLEIVLGTLYKPIFIWIVDEVAISGYFYLQG